MIPELEPLKAYLPSVKDFRVAQNLRRKRSTYSIGNGFKFKPVFDEAIRTRKDILIPYESAPSGFHIKISDGLKWLVDNWDKEEYSHLRDQSYAPSKYAKFRGEIKLRATIEGVLIHWNTSVVTPHFQIIENIAVINWKDELMSFLEGEEKILKLEHLYLSPDDINYINTTLGTISGVVFEVETTKLLVGKNL